MRAALYIRVSTKAQADKWSLPAQRKSLMALAESRDWEATVYDEGGISGETIKDRPQMRRLLEDIAQGKVGVLAVVEQERLCRSAGADWDMISTTCRIAGVKVVTGGLELDFSQAEDDFMGGLFAILAKREKRKMLERMIRGQNERKDRGKWTGKSPWGYRYDVALGTLVPIQAKRRWVRMVFLDRNRSARSIKMMIYASGHIIGDHTIAHMRTNPHYYGVMRNTGGQLIRGDWEPIITEKEWRENQRPKRRVPKAEGSARHLLSGVVRCAGCGRTILGTMGARALVYRCYRTALSYSCPNRGTLIGWVLEACVLHGVSGELNPKRIRKSWAELEAKLNKQTGNDSKDAIEAELKQIETERCRLIDAVQAGALKHRHVHASMEALEADEDRARGRLRALQFQPVELPPVEMLIEQAESLMQRDQARQRDVIGSVLDDAILDFGERRLRLLWVYGGETVYKIPQFFGNLKRSGQVDPGDFVTSS